MEIVVSLPALAGPGGVQSYVLTVAPQLERLGHEVWLYAPVQGEMALEARRRGLRVAADEHELPARCDAILAQDAPTLLDLAGRYESARRVIVVHGAELDIHLPLNLEGMVHAVVALNDAVHERVRATALAPRVVRLSQPIDVWHFRHSESRPQAKRVLLLGNYLEGAYQREFLAACQSAGLECRQLGVHGGESDPDPLNALHRADIVVGLGRSILEGMACQRAAWVYSGRTGDGWVTPERYGALEADGFRGRALPDVLDAAAFVRDLATYDAQMGQHNHALVQKHHRAEEHAIVLVDVMRELAPSPPPAGPLREMARMVRVQYDGETRATKAARDREHAGKELLRLDTELRETREQLDAVLATRRWKLSGLLARPLERARRRLGR